MFFHPYYSSLPFKCVGEQMDENISMFVIGISAWTVKVNGKFPSVVFLQAKWFGSF